MTWNCGLDVAKVNSLRYAFETFYSRWILIQKWQFIFKRASRYALEGNIHSVWVQSISVRPAERKWRKPTESIRDKFQTEAVIQQNKQRNCFARSNKAEIEKYSPAGLHALKGFLRLQVRIIAGLKLQTLQTYKSIHNSFNKSKTCHTLFYSSAAFFNLIMRKTGHTIN